MESFFTPTQQVEAEIEVKRCRFIAVVAPAPDEAAARQLIDEQRRLHPKARHHCSAFRVCDGAVWRSDDDGEPSGTAGAPIADALDGEHAVNTVAVVTRYFGGVLLGTGGLTRAYGGAAREALSMASLTKMIRLRCLRVTVDYAVAARMDAASAPWQVLGAQYGADVVLLLGVAGDVDAAAATVRDLSSGAASIEAAGTAYAPAPG